MSIIKNPVEMVDGRISCTLVLGEKEYPHIMLSNSKYEISEDSEWSEIKPCDPAAKTAHEQAEARAVINQKARSYLKSTDWYVLRAMDSGEPMPDDIKLARAEAREKIAA